MKSHYKVIRKSEGRMHRIAESILLTNDVGMSATVKVEDYHRHETSADNLIYYVREGELQFTVDDEVVVLTEGDSCFIDKNTDYEIRGTASFILMKRPLFGSLF